MGVGYSLSEEWAVCIVSPIPRVEEDYYWWECKTLSKEKMGRRSME